MLSSSSLLSRCLDRSIQAATVQTSDLYHERNCALQLPGERFLRQVLTFIAIKLKNRLLYYDFSSYVKAVGAHRFHSLGKILLPSKCIAQSNFFYDFLTRPQFQPDQDSGLPAQVYGLMDLQTYKLTHNTIT